MVRIILSRPSRRICVRRGVVAEKDSWFDGGRENDGHDTMSFISYLILQMYNVKERQGAEGDVRVKPP